ESMNTMDSPSRSPKKRTAPSSTAAEAQRYVQRQNASSKRRRSNDDTYNYEIPRDFRHNKQLYAQQAEAERKSKTGIIAVFAIAFLLIAAYFLGVIWCSKGFLPNTYMNDIDISGMTVDEAKSAVIDAVEVKGLTFIKNKGEEVHFSGDEFGASISMPDDSSFDEAASQSIFLWFKNYFGRADYSTKLISIYDEGRLANLITDYKWGSAPPTDAYLQKQADGTYVIIPEDNGDMVDTDVLVKYALEKVKEGKTVIDMRECEDCFLTAEVTEESLQQACEEANSLAGLTITYDFDDRQEVLESAVIVEWVSSDSQGNIVVDKNAAEAWVQANLADKYDTFIPGYVRSFHSTLQGTVELPLGDYGIYGWQTDVDATTDKLIEYIEEGKSVTVEPEYIKRGYCRATDDIGDTYIEIDITNQHVWYYENGELIMDSDCVTGTATDPDRATPTGVFQLWSKERDVVLKGANYAAPVSFWMYFTECGVGLHDYGRSAFGGDIYMYNGSHGCINLPYDFASELFEATEINIPVLVIP
ncbi:MAG: L,D-transpeptidase family protein, partial [Ruminococcus sp.]